ncbi:MAG: ISKra4 family transposase [Gemmataceae bacterium]|nr:ISKra4 family transposase [Gemmataceae bacterium]
MSCVQCKESASFKEYRHKNVVCLLGDIRIARGYYHCKHCGHGHFPWDGVLRLSERALTLGAEEIVTLGGSLDAFGTVAKRTLPKMSGLKLSESTVQRTTEDAGKRLAEQLQAGKTFGQKTVWDWHIDANGKTCAYLSVDATGVMMQGPEGAKADGRMAYVGMIFNPQPRQTEDERLSRPCDGVRYLAGHYTLAELGEQMRRQAAQVGVGQATQWIALTDAGSGLEHWIDMYFPLAIKIVDFHHASEYLENLAKVYRSDAEGKTLTDEWCHRLKHEGGAVMLKELQGLDLRRLSKAARKMYDAALTYFTNHVGRMNYPEYLSNGWHIGSGGVESACKTVVNQRLCLGGMRWCEAGSDHVCHLRALYRSDPDQWEAYWGYPDYAMAA